MSTISVDLTEARNAFERFLSTHQHTHLDVLRDWAAQKRERIAQCEEILTRLASRGMREELPTLLSTLLQEWAELEAATLLVQFPTTRLTAADPDLQQHFSSNLARLYRTQSSRVLLLLKQYEQARGAEQEQRDTRWQTLAHSAIERQHEATRHSEQRQHDLLDRLQQTNQQWFERQQDMAERSWQTNQQWFEREQKLMSQSQQANQQWAQLALTGIQQGQLGVQQYTQFAASTQASVAKMLEASAQTQTELAQSMKASRKRGGCLRTITITALAALTIFVLVYGLAFLGATHLFPGK